jgi:hypothetical protein
LSLIEDKQLMPLLLEMESVQGTGENIQRFLS